MPDAITYPLSLARSYVRHWGLKEAVRELIQNALDSESPFEYAFGDNSLSITSRYASLSPRTLLLGATSKADDPEAIGSFGEGYKLALLVLVRAGYAVTVYNAERIWTPAFERNETFGEDMLVIREEMAPADTMAVTFEIRGLATGDREAIREMCLLMQPAMDDVIGVEQGFILPSRPGKLYVGGLYVCDTDLSYGYDIKPQHIKLERDRQTVSDFDLKYTAERMWTATKNWDRVVDMLEAEAPDLETMRYGTPAAGLVDHAVKRFHAKHAQSVPVTSQAEADRYQRDRAVFTPKALSHVLWHSPAISGLVAHAVKEKTPRQVLETWLDDHQKYLRRLPKVAFKKLMQQAENWKATDAHPF